MSYNSHRKKVREENLPLEQRASHLRSCALSVAGRLNVHREDIIQRLHQLTGVDLYQPQNEKNVLLAMDVLEQIRSEDPNLEDSETILKFARDESWDLDTSMNEESLWESPLGRFVANFETRHGYRRLMILALFAARRAVACWRLICDGTEPYEAIHLAESILFSDRNPADLAPFCRRCTPSLKGVTITDCRACDTGCAAEAVAQMAQFILHNETRNAAFCLSAADMAFDQSPLASMDQFRRWLIEVAIPAAQADRELNQEEATRFATYTQEELDQERIQASAIERLGKKHWFQFWE